MLSKYRGAAFTNRTTELRELNLRAHLSLLDVCYVEFSWELLALRSESRNSCTDDFTNALYRTNYARGLISETAFQIFGVVSYVLRFGRILSLGMKLIGDDVDPVVYSKYCLSMLAPLLIGLYGNDKEVREALAGEVEQ